jgi:hypothetical protein
MLEAGALLGLLVDAGVVTVDHDAGIVNITAGARALDGDALEHPPGCAPSSIGPRQTNARFACFRAVSP